MPYQLPPFSVLTLSIWRKCFAGRLLRSTDKALQLALRLSECRGWFSCIFTALLYCTLGVWQCGLFLHAWKKLIFLDMIIAPEYYRKSKEWKTPLWFNFLCQFHIYTWQAHCWFIIKSETQINKTLAVSDWLLWCGRNKCCVITNFRHAMRAPRGCCRVLGWGFSLWVGWLVIETQRGTVFSWLRGCVDGLSFNETSGHGFIKTLASPKRSTQEACSIFFVVKFTPSVTHRSVASCYPADFPCIIQNTD